MCADWIAVASSGTNFHLAGIWRLDEDKHTRVGWYANFGKQRVPDDVPFSKLTFPSLC